MKGEKEAGSSLLGMCGLAYSRKLRTCFFDHHQPSLGAYQRLRGVTLGRVQLGAQQRFAADFDRCPPHHTAPGALDTNLDPLCSRECQQMTGVGFSGAAFQSTWPGRDPRILAPLPTHRGPGTPKLQRLLWHPAEEHGCHRQTAELGGCGRRDVSNLFHPWWLTLQGSASWFHGDHELIQYRTFACENFGEVGPRAKLKHKDR